MGSLVVRHLHYSYNSCNYHHSLLLLLTLAAFALLFCSASASASASVSKEAGSGGWADQKSTLGGPGSSPPTCRSKCGRCWPCKPVHVPIQPGLSMPLEYYPEAWRCKCGNNLFMP